MPAERSGHATWLRPFTGRPADVHVPKDTDTPCAGRYPRSMNKTPRLLFLALGAALTTGACGTTASDATDRPLISSNDIP